MEVYRSLGVSTLVALMESHQTEAKRRPPGKRGTHTHPGQVEKSLREETVEACADRHRTVGRGTGRGS
jgi:hypothetical protein